MATFPVNPKGRGYGEKAAGKDSSAALKVSKQTLEQQEVTDTFASKKKVKVQPK